MFDVDPLKCLLLFFVCLFCFLMNSVKSVVGKKPFLNPMLANVVQDRKVGKVLHSLYVTVLLSLALKCLQGVIFYLFFYPAAITTFIPP